VLSKSINIKKIDFDDIFTTRLRSDLPKSLKYLIDSIIGRDIEELNLSNNAFGPDGVASFQ
jgi:Ran GTPase-activating protein (RanGAP) involved in mRNA processing and transport